MIPLTPTEFQLRHNRTFVDALTRQVNGLALGQYVDGIPDGFDFEHHLSVSPEVTRTGIDTYRVVVSVQTRGLTGLLAPGLLDDAGTTASPRFDALNTGHIRGDEFDQMEELLSRRYAPQVEAATEAAIDHDDDGIDLFIEFTTTAQSAQKAALQVACGLSVGHFYVDPHIEASRELVSVFTGKRRNTLIRTITS